MQSLKTIFKWMLVGAISGIMIAAFFITLYQLGIRPFSWDGIIDSATLIFCPFFIFGFSSDVTSMTELILITIIGNAFLYGVLFGLIASVVVLIRRLAARRAS